MQIDLAEIQQFLPATGGHLSMELRDDQGRLVATAKFDFTSIERTMTNRVSESSEPTSQHGDEDAPGPNFLSILT